MALVIMIIITPILISITRIPITTEPAFTTVTVSGDLLITRTITIRLLTGCTTTAGPGELVTARDGETNGEAITIHGIPGATILTVAAADMVTATILMAAQILMDMAQAIMVEATTIIITTASTTT